jgi:hypothetical protein
MREIGPGIPRERYEQIVVAAEAFFAAAHNRREVRASDFAMEIEGNPVLTTEGDVKWPEGRMRVAKTLPTARPPFEWLIEITANIDEGDYFKHYLVREDDVVLAQRRELTPIDEIEAKIILEDLATAQRVL